MVSHLYTVGFHGVGGAIVEVPYVRLVEIRDALFGHGFAIISVINNDEKVILDSDYYLFTIGPYRHFTRSSLV